MRPPTIATVAAMRTAAKGRLERNPPFLASDAASALASMPKDALQYPQRRQHRDEGAATLAYQRQRHTRHRNQSNVNADVHKHLEEDKRHHANGDEAAEGIIGEPGDAEAAEQQCDEQSEQHHRADEAELLGADAEDVIRGL